MKAIFWTIFAICLTLPLFGQLDQLEITDADGNQVKLETYLDEDRNHLIIFWASWCSICRRELEQIESFYESWLNEYNTEVFAVSMDSESGRANARQLFELNEYPYDLIYAPASDVRDALGISSQPHTYLIDQDMNQVFYKRGFRSGDENELDAEIRNAFETSQTIDPSPSEPEFQIMPIENGYRVRWENPLTQEAELNVYNSLGQRLGSWTVASGESQILLRVNRAKDQNTILELRSGNKQISRVLP